MKITTLALTAACALLVTELTAQISVGGYPASLRSRMDASDVPTIRATGFDAAQIAAEDAAANSMHKNPRCGKVLPIDVDPYVDGTWSTLPNGDRIWRVRIKSEGALELDLDMADYNLPSGAVLFVYDDEARNIYGGFDEYHNKPSGVFAMGSVPGEACIVEYNEPAGVAGQGYFRITGVGHTYRLGGEDRADFCEVDVNCSPEGDGMFQQRDAVVRIKVRINGSDYWCSGSLVNNLHQDCKAYFLTADHCAEGVLDGDFALWKFYFRYQRSTCGSGSASTGKVLTGCEFRASSDDNGGDQGSDFFLVEGVDPIPANYTPFWAGWDANNTAVAGAKGIHHPAASEKKISTVLGNTQSATWWQVPNTHWRVRWAETANGAGVTEGGSSGSPLFNTSGRIIGTLTGGASCCEQGGCGNSNFGPNEPDFYGKMSYHWTSNPGDDLKTFLDPANTGNLTMDGMYSPCIVNGISDIEAMPAPAIVPNPATDVVRITVSDRATGPVQLEIVDVLGALVLSTTINGLQADLDISELRAGTYFVRWTQGDQISSTAQLTVLGN